MVTLPPPPSTARTSHNFHHPLPKPSLTRPCVNLTFTQVAFYGEVNPSATFETGLIIEGGLNTFMIKVRVVEGGGVGLVPAKPT